MLRRSLSASRIISRVAVRRHESYRQSSSSGSAGGMSSMSVAAAVTSVGIGGVMGYAFFDPGFRKSVENNVPGASDVFSSLYGPADTPPPKKEIRPPSSPKLKITRIPEPEVIEPPKVAPVLTKKSENIPSKKESVLTPPKQNYENIYKDKISSLQTLLKEASSATLKSNEATTSHMTLLQQAMENTDDRDDKSWDKVFNAANLKREANKNARELIEKSNFAIKELIDVVEKEKKELEEIGILAKAEEEVKKAVEELQSLSDKMLEVQKSAKTVDEFRDMVEKEKKAIQQEIASILSPEGPETKEDFEIVVLHAYKKIFALQQELAKQKTLEQQKFEKFIEDLKVEKNMEAQNTIQSALDAQRIELEKEIVRSKQSVREEIEAELRMQLKRQAAAHFDHLNDTKEIQEKEISRKYERQLHEILLKETTSQNAKMAEITGAYEGLLTALEKRGDADENIVNAQNLWLAATNLYQNVIKGGVPLKPGLEELKAYVSSEDDKKFITAILKTIDSQSIESGVSGEEEIRHRFLKIERLANQTAMIGSEGASPLMYLLSYLQSLFIRSPDSMRSYTDEIDLENLDTFDITNLARFSLDRGNIEQAVRYMTLLKGQPKNIARDWIVDARRVLEIRQACEAIIAQASSSGVQFPSK